MRRKYKRNAPRIRTKTRERKVAWGTVESNKNPTSSREKPERLSTSGNPLRRSSSSEKRKDPGFEKGMERSNSRSKLPTVDAQEDGAHGVKQAWTLESPRSQEESPQAKAYTYWKRQSQKQAKLQRRRAKLKDYDYLVVNVRDLKFRLKPKDASQQCKWLSYVAKFRYAQYSRGRVHSNQLVVTEVTDCAGRSMNPFAKLRRHLDNRDSVKVSLALDKPGRKKTPFEVMLNASKNDYIDLTIYYDGERPEDGFTVMLHSNHNFWETPIPMREEGQDICARIRVPLGYPLKFFFEVNKSLRVSKRYGKGIVSFGGAVRIEVNILTVDKFRSIKLFEEKKPKLLSSLRPGQKRPTNIKHAENKKITHKWDFKLPSRPGGNEFYSLFEKDWSEIQINDIIPKYDQRTLVKEALQKHWNDLQQIFRYHAGMKEPISYMNKMEFMNFCTLMKFYDQNVVGSDATEIFTRVNLEDEYDSDDEIKVRATGGIKIVEQEDNPDHLFIRSEFLESLIRLSLRKYHELDPDEAMSKFVIMVISKNQYCIDTIERIRVLSGSKEVATAIAPYLKKLYQKVFRTIATCDVISRDVGDGTISFQEYGSWLHAKGLVTHKGGLGVTRRKLTMSFSLTVEPRLGFPDDELMWERMIEMLCRIANEMGVDQAKETDVLAKRVTKLCKLLVGRRGVCMRNRAISLRHTSVTF